MKPDEICEIFSERNIKITIKILDGDTVLIEGKSDGLRFLANLLLSLESASDDNSFHISPDGAGNIFFSPETTHGIYIHRLEE